MVVDCVKAIIGWEPTSSLGSPNIGIAYLTLFGKDLVIGLCGVEELTKPSNTNILSGMVAIQSGGGSWTKALRHLSPGVILINPSKYTTFKGTYGGVLPRLDQSYEKTFDALIGEFENIWSNLTYHERATERKLVFFCKAGRHRSYALLIAFLMWAGHVHDHSVWANLIAPPALAGQGQVRADLGKDPGPQRLGAVRGHPRPVRPVPKLEFEV